MAVSLCYLRVLCVGRRSFDSQDERPQNRIQNDPNHLRLRTMKTNKYKRKRKTKNENQNQNKQNIINDNFWSFAHLELAPNVYSIFFLFINFPFHSSCLRAISLYATKRERIKRSKGSRNDLMDRFLTVGRADIRHVYILNLERYRYRSEPTASPEAKSKSSRKPFSNS